jgi:hypothetical protein
MSLIIGCSIHPESVTLVVMSIGAPQSGQAGALPSWTCLQYRQR